MSQMRVLIAKPFWADFPAGVSGFVFFSGAAAIAANTATSVYISIYY